MFSISQLLVNYWNLPFKEYSSLLIGLSIYSVMYVYLLYSNTELLTILNKSVIFLFIIDFVLTYFIYGYNKNKKLKNTDDLNIDNDETVKENINETDLKSIDEELNEELNKELDNCFANTEIASDSDTESEFIDKSHITEIEEELIE